MQVDALEQVNGLEPGSSKGMRGAGLPAQPTQPNLVARGSRFSILDGCEEDSNFVQSIASLKQKIQALLSPSERRPTQDQTRGKFPAHTKA